MPFGCVVLPFESNRWMPENGFQRHAKKIIMKAVFFEQPGGKEVLQYGELPTPTPKPGEALIRVRASGLNHLDIWLREGARQISYPHVLGSDVSGILEQVNGPSTLKIGDEVILNPAIPCGKCARCRKNEPCELVEIFGVKRWGGYAEYVTAPLAQLYKKPTRLSFEESAAFPLTFLTAWHMLIGRAHLQRGESVFIWGASGGLGSSALKIAKYLGVRIIAATKSNEAAQELRNLGADEVIVYSKEDVVESVKKLTDKQGVDVVFESVGEKTWQTSLALLRPHGRLVIAGSTSGEKGELNLSDLYVRQLTIIGARMGTKEEFEDILGLANEGKLRPIIDRIFPLQDAAQAHERMEQRQHIGKIVLMVVP